MPAAEADLQNEQKLPFPPITKQHILNCSFHSWYPRYRTVTPKVRLIPLSPAFVDYLRADGIILPPETNIPSGSENEDTLFSPTASDADDTDSDGEEADPSTAWSEIHTAVSSTISSLSGAVAPKLNWSAPKDATWISATNSMECRTPNDIYLLLKSSNFITHDLEHAFDGCVAEPVGTEPLTVRDVPYHLVLRKWLQMNPSVEFRCFVRNRRLLGICQRDLNHFDFLEPMVDDLREVIQEFFEAKLRDSFPDENFAFDVYIPAPHKRVWLVDVNPWAPRTDPLLFSWMELLEMEEPLIEDGKGEEDARAFVRLSLNSPERGQAGVPEGSEQPYTLAPRDGDNRSDDSRDGEEEDVEAEIWQPEFRLIRNTDPEAYNFNTPQYSAHKLPRDVVEASQGGAGPQRELLEQWQEVLARMQKEDKEYESSEEERD